ncbi:GLPGLI family protein [Kaistella montana]|uniref:GLPGLI family protein n=1 Tax=Kaistella montana TaxID=1849733 RepID=A0ABW5K6G0_9FLAO|nr:GLPGLI family protein [Kaistella montana]MCQ4034561.1 GLPGLI family protein [Kaistella montana]
MKIKLFILILTLSVFVFPKAQTHRFIYDVPYKKDSTSTILTKENYILDIGPTETKYYTYDFFIADSLISNNIPFPKEMKLNTSDIIVHKNNSNAFSQYDLLENTVLNLQTTDIQNWKLSNENKRVKELNLQKATTTWGGRNWTAWFTMDIPFQEGPYKFHGLPGLIVEIFDDKNNYHFQLAKSENKKALVENQFIEMAIEMSVPITLEKYKTTKLKYYESPINFIKNGIGETNSDQFFLNDGTFVNCKNSREINEQLKNIIKKYNNPIELDKAIVYPK